MKTVLIFAVAVSLATGGPVLDHLDQLDRSNYPQIIEFPDGEGVMHKVDLTAEPDYELLAEYEKKASDNVYLLFTRRNPTSAQTLDMNNNESILNSNFNPDLQTVVIVHGWMSNRNTEPNPTIRATYLNKSDVNVIVVNWSKLAVNVYNTAVYGVPSVGRGVGQFLGHLMSLTGAKASNMHLIGFSLGAHVVGNAGRFLGGKVARVTGLDPAGPLWNYNSNRLGPNDGVYVEAIHTDGGLSGLGIGSAIAQADFFPNGGNSQPGCYTSICNHNRAWELFAASVTYNHLVGKKCSTNFQLTWNICGGVELKLGNDDLQKWGNGMYRLDTGRRFPF